MCPSLLVVWALGLAAAGAEEAMGPQSNVYGYKDTDITQGLGYGHHLHPFYYRGASKRYYNCAIEDDWKPFASDKSKPQKTTSPPKKFSHLAEMYKGKPTQSPILHKLLPKLFNEMRTAKKRMQRRGDSGYEVEDHLEEEHARLVKDINEMTDPLSKSSRYVITRLLPVGLPHHATVFTDQQPSAYNLHFDQHPSPYNQHTDQQSLAMNQHTSSYEQPADSNLQETQQSSAYNLHIDKHNLAYELPVNQDDIGYNMPVEQHPSNYNVPLDKQVSDYNSNVPYNNPPADQHVTNYNPPVDPHASSFLVRKEVEPHTVIKMLVFKQQPITKSPEEVTSTAKPYNSLAVEVNGQTEPFRLVPLVPIVPLVPLVPVPVRAVYRPVPYKGYVPVAYKLLKQVPTKPSFLEKVLKYFPKIL